MQRSSRNSGMITRAMERSAKNSRVQKNSEDICDNSEERVDSMPLMLRRLRSNLVNTATGSQQRKKPAIDSSESSTESEHAVQKSTKKSSGRTEKSLIRMSNNTSESEDDDVRSTKSKTTSNSRNLRSRDRSSKYLSRQSTRSKGKNSKASRTRNTRSSSETESMSRARVKKSRAERSEKDKADEIALLNSDSNSSGQESTNESRKKSPCLSLEEKESDEEEAETQALLHSDSNTDKMTEESEDETTGKSANLNSTSDNGSLENVENKQPCKEKKTEKSNSNLDNASEKQEEEKKKSADKKPDKKSRKRSVSFSSSNEVASGVVSKPVSEFESKRRKRFNLEKNPYYLKDEKLRIEPVVVLKKMKNIELRKYSKALKQLRELVENKKLERLLFLDSLQVKRKRDGNLESDSSDNNKKSKSKCQKNKESEENLLDHFDKNKNKSEDLSGVSSSDLENSRKKEDKIVPKEELLNRADDMAKQALLGEDSDRFKANDAEDVTERQTLCNQMVGRRLILMIRMSANAEPMFADDDIMEIPRSTGTSNKSHKRNKSI